MGFLFHETFLYNICTSNPHYIIRLLLYIKSLSRYRSPRLRSKANNKSLALVINSAVLKMQIFYANMLYHICR